MAHHVLKSWPQFFQPILDGAKKHDMRSIQDRTFAIGDTLLLEEFDPFGGGYTGRSLEARVTFITSKDTPCAFSSSWLDNAAAILSLEVQ